MDILEKQKLRKEIEEGLKERFEEYREINEEFLEIQKYTFYYDEN